MGLGLVTLVTKNLCGKMRKNHYLCKVNTFRQMQSRFIQYLTLKNLTFQNNVEEQISFQFDGLNYIFVYDNSDSNFFRLLLPNIYSIEKERSIYDILINDFNSMYKVVKAIITSQNQIWLSVEQFVYSEDNIDLLFERSVMLLKATIELFQKRINEVDSGRTV